MFIKSNWLDTNNKQITFPLEIKETKAKDNDVTFEGKASVFNIVDSDNDVIAPGAFSESLKEWKKKGRLPALLWQHDWREPIGKYDEIYENDESLDVKGRLFVSDIAKAKEAGRLLKEKAIDGLSIGFMNSGPFIIDEERQTRTIQKADLWEVSIVTFPALSEARIETVKSKFIKSDELPEFRKLSDIEKFLRDIGFSKKSAMMLISNIKNLSESSNDIDEIKQTLDSLLKTLTITNTK